MSAELWRVLNAKGGRCEDQHLFQLIMPCSGKTTSEVSTNAVSDAPVQMQDPCQGPDAPALGLRHDTSKHLLKVIHNLMASGATNHLRCTDALCRWSNGRFKSGLHRVVIHKGQERYSTAFFAEPNFKAVIAPLPTCVSEQNPAKWPPTTSGEYLLGRYGVTHGTYMEREKEKAAAQQPCTAATPVAVN